MAMSAAAQAAFGWPSNLRHAPGPPDEEKGGFRSACRCGYPGKWTKASPSHAHQHTRNHAEAENAREQGGGALVEEYADNGQPAKARRTAPAGSSVASRVSGGTPCGCGCGEPSGGLFRPGHDSKLLSRLLKSVKEGGATLADALSEMNDIGCSVKLKEKFVKRAGGEKIGAKS